MVIQFAIEIQSNISNAPGFNITKSVSELLFLYSVLRDIQNKLTRITVLIYLGNKNLVTKGVCCSMIQIPQIPAFDLNPSRAEGGAVCHRVHP